MKKIISLISVFAIILVGCNTQKYNEENLVIYSARDYEVDEKIIQDFEEMTGAKVDLYQAESDEILARLEAEGENTPADIIIMNGGQYIYPLQEMKVLAPIKKSEINEAVTPEYIGEDWVALTERARVIVVNPDNIKSENITSYEDLTNNEYADDILIRSSTNSYNQAMIESFIIEYGSENTQNWANSITNNMARDPEGNDRDQVKALANGIGNIAVVNSYYLHKLANSEDPEEVAAVENIEVIFPETTHTNITWLGVTKKGENNKLAEEFIKYVTSEEVQTLFVTENGEFATNQNVKKPQINGNDVTYTRQEVNFEDLGKYNQEALKIFDEAGWQ